MPFFHVSPHKNAGSIFMSGIEPVFAVSKDQKIWIVDRPRLLWAIAHCSARHHTPVNELDIWQLPDVISKLRRTKWRGVYTTTCRIRPHDVISAQKFVEMPDNGGKKRLHDAQPSIFDWS